MFRSPSKLSTRHLSLALLFLSLSLALCASLQARPAEPDEPIITRDEKGRLQRAEKPGNVTEYFYDEHDRPIRQESTRFGTRTTEYVPTERVTPKVGTVRRNVVTTPIGSWESRFLYSSEGHRLVSAHGVNDELFFRAMGQLAPYFWPQGLPGRTLAALDSIPGRGYSSRLREERDGVAIQRTEAFGQAMEITEVRLGELRKEVRDDRGGWRVQQRGRGGLLSAEDEHGPLLRSFFDSLGRPARQVIGGNLVLSYVYEGESRNWSELILHNEADGALMGRWKPAEAFETLREARMPRRRILVAHDSGLGTVAEWDDHLYQEGVIMVSLWGDPYALLPFDTQRGVQTLWRSLIATGGHRIDYTESELRLYVALGSTRLARSGEAVATIVRPRRKVAQASEAEATP